MSGIAYYLNLNNDKLSIQIIYLFEMISKKYPKLFITKLY